MRALIFGVLMWMGVAQAQTFAMPPALLEVGPKWSAVGSGNMRWLGLKIYDITLWSSGATFDHKTPYALAIRYARNIPGDELVKASIDQLRHLGFRDDVQLGRWAQALAGVFPSVKPGESIIGVHQPGVGARFFHQGKLTGTLDDAALARAFFAIWLDEKTSEPALRAQLLGRK